MKITMEVDIANAEQLRAAQELIAAQLRLLGPSTGIADQGAPDVVAVIEAMWPEPSRSQTCFWNARSV